MSAPGIDKCGARSGAREPEADPGIPCRSMPGSLSIRYTQHSATLQTPLASHEEEWVEWASTDALSVQKL